MKDFSNLLNFRESYFHVMFINRSSHHHQLHTTIMHMRRNPRRAIYCRRLCIVADLTMGSERMQGLLFGVALGEVVRSGSVGRRRGGPP
jgi:hypothetical protein